MRKHITPIWFCKSFDELSVSQLYYILKLRNEVFVVEQDCAYQDCDNKDPQSLHLWGVLDQDIVAYARIVPPGVSYPEASIGRVATNRAYRRLSFGRELMKRAIDATVEQYGPINIRISAQSYLQQFYEGFGFMKVSEEYLEDDIPHIEMLWDHTK
ncbi:GNAT family N-acetyltransferase [Sphingobacterium sp. SYP-B4668]|uniref:GNAT family N-acetyltransferase n=1 Tax=Sphingobacterium sp. SYP-B4668 TaxID=2996035 RepID=UPI0022DDC4D2|nr:GNAT family N-acetyltransferase [Sphingobacterium sp. SYP-B4668]